MTSAWQTFLSQLSNFDQKVFSLNTRQRLCAYRIIQFLPNSRGFDLLALPDNTRLPIAYPNCALNQIPYRLNSQAFIEYFGLGPTLALEIFCKAARRNYGVISGEILLTEVKLHVVHSVNVENPPWKERFGAEISPDSVDDNTIMNWLGFDNDLIAEVNQLKDATSRNPDEMKDYLDQEEPNRAFEDLDIVDYLIMIFLQRVANLICLEDIMKKYMDNL